MCPLWLPEEVWILMLGYLPFLDRLRLRTTCKFFRNLVDNDLWTGWTVDLGRSRDKYEEHFWETLRRWRVTSVRLSSFDVELADLAKELPGLTTLIIRFRQLSNMGDFRSFTNLDRLYLTYLSSPIHFEDLSPVMPPQLTHLTVCRMFNTNALPAEIPPDSQFKKLKSLTFHCKFDLHPAYVVHFLLSSLPQLQHLSLMTYTGPSFEENIPDLPPLHNCSLSSLELLRRDIEHFPVDIMKMLSTLPFLRSLAVICLYDYQDNYWDELLSAWLKDLPALTSLVVECAQMIAFVESIPSSVTHLTLLPPYIDSELLTALSAQLPNLRHLRLEPFLDPLASNAELIPQLFPGLRTLCLSHENVPEDVFLSLASLKELEVLETVDKEPLPSALVSKLRAVTNNKVQIYKSPRKPCLHFCDCATNIHVNRESFHTHRLKDLVCCY